MDITKAKAWFFLFRPWSYAATLVPFLAALAIVPPSHGMLRWWAGLTAGILFQATVNLLNTWGDERSGVDDAPGAIRSTPQVHDGTISMKAVLIAAIICATLAAVIGLSLCLYAENDRWNISWPLLITGVIGFLGATNYSTGIKFKYIGLGVPFVAFLMGTLEIAAAICILRPADATSALTPELAVLSIPIASLVCVIMHGNDMRDIRSDRAAGIRTCASLAGPKVALAIYWGCHLLPYAVCSMLVVEYGRMMLIPFFALPLTRRTLVRATRVYLECPNDPHWIRLERASGGIHLVFGILYALALRLTVYSCGI